MTRPLRTLRALLHEQARQRPLAAAILADERLPLSYSRLVQHLDETASCLGRFGVARGDRVAIVLPNGPEMAVTFLAVAACTASAPLNPGYRDEEFAFYLADLQAKAVIVPAGSDVWPARDVAHRLGITVFDLAPSHEAAGLFTLHPSLVRDPAGRGDFSRLAPGDEDDLALILHTSGTTARPKMAPLTQRNLCVSARNVARSLRLTPADRCLNIMPLFHIHGLVAALLASLAAGGSVICTPGLEAGPEATRFFDSLSRWQPTWYTAVPTMHQAILASARAAGRSVGSQLRFLRSSSASLPPPVMAELENVFRAPVIEAYGMTEASHQMTSNPLPPLARKPGSVGLPAGPEVAIMAEDGSELLPAGRRGEVVIRGENVTTGYLANPEATSKAFSAGWFRTGDQGYFDSDGYLYLSGRLKEIINRGGEKVSPREVDEALLEHPAVAQAVAFAHPHPTLGEDVAAAVVLRPGCHASAEELRRLAFERLADWKVPSQIIIVDSIPKGPTGKLQRIGLHEKLAGQLKADYVAPRNPAEQTIAGMWQDVLALAPIGVFDNFFSLGGDSLSAAQVVSRLRKAFDLDLPLRRLFETPTIAGLAAYIEERKATRWEVETGSLASAATSTAERQALIEMGKATARFAAGDLCLHERFALQAARTPDRVAASMRRGAGPSLALPAGPSASLLGGDGRDTATYAELNRSANRLAHSLLQRGVSAETRVALCLDRSLDMLVAILGVLKAGGAYVPIEPATPPERIAYILADSGAALLLAHSATLSQIPATTIPIVDLDTERAVIAAAPDDDPDAAVSLQQMAYVIYTSGSTGKPKGVLVEHGHVTRLFAAARSLFQFDQDDVWTLFHSYAFDFSVWEMWGAWLHGGRLVIVPREVSRNAEEFHQLLYDEQVTVLNQTPSAFAVLMRANEAAREGARYSATDGPEQQRLGRSLPSLRYVIFGGEKLDFEGLRPWIERYGDQQPRLVNMYGITETTVHVTYRPIRLRDLQLDAGSRAMGLRVGSPVGQPLADLSLHILDRDLSPVPVGVPGEIYVGGAGVARGYLNRPALTAERFRPDPFADAPGARLYRSGDLANRTPDGDIEYLGRADQQVKIRGYRVEIGEIEAALKQLDGVVDAAVVVREAGEGADGVSNQRLTAYIVPATGEEGGWGAGSADRFTADLRRRLSGWLPPYMIPADFILLGTLPQTANGKLDRAAMRSFDRPQQQIPAGAGASLTRLEMLALESDPSTVEQMIALLTQLSPDEVGRLLDS